MRQKYIVNTSNLQKGGALQVAASFAQEASKMTEIDFHIILGTASSKVISADEYKDSHNISFSFVNIHPTDSILAILKFRKILSKIEKQVSPNGVITVFGPCYWKPNAPHIMGFANGYLLYEDTFFFSIWRDWKSLKYRLKKKFHQYLLKREANFFWTETEDSKLRLARFINKPLKNITVATNNCSNFFRKENYQVLPNLAPKKGIRLLYLSSYYPHKGFELLPPILMKLKDGQIDVELVVTITDEDYKRVFSGFDNVINLGSIHPKYCPYLYQQSDIILVPTLLETFTAVYPEAMFSQKPILTTDLPFARDICGDAAIYFDPASAEDATRKIQRLLSDCSLERELVRKGLERVKMFDLPEERLRKVLDAILRDNISKQ